MYRNYRNIKGYLANTWVVSNPYILKRLLRGFIRALLFGKNTLRAIEIYPTMQCNLACPMCAVEKFKKVKGKPLGLEEYNKIAKDGVRLGAISLTILGGEPLLLDNLEEIISIFHEEHYYIHIVTNSTLLTRDRLQKLRDAGLNGICFSLDSMDREKNDRIRGIDGHYQKVLDSIPIAREIGLTVNIAPVFFPHQIEDAIEVVKYCQREGLGANGTQISPVGGWEGGPVLSPQEKERIRHLVREYPRLSFDWSLSYFLKMRCPGGKEKIAITPFGDVLTCGINPISFGNAREESLKKILQRMQSLPEIKNDNPACLASDLHYIEKYLRPLPHFVSYPVSYLNHPSIPLEMKSDSML